MADEYDQPIIGAPPEGEKLQEEVQNEDLGLDELDESQPISDNLDLKADDDFRDKSRSSADLEAVYDIPVQVSAVLGKSSMQVHNLLKLSRGAVVELDRKVGEAIDIYVNDRLVARGEVVVVEERLGITMTEIVKAERG